MKYQNLLMQDGKGFFGNADAGIKHWHKIAEMQVNVCLESLPLYRHKELYEWNELYQRHKFFTEKDFEDERRLWRLEQTGHYDYAIAHNDKDFMDDSEEGWRYSDRYRTLKPNTVFFKNLMKLTDLRWNALSYSEYVLRAAVLGIDQRLVNFELLYTWFARRRQFSFDYWNEDYKPGTGDDGKDYKPDPGDNYEQWVKFREMCKEAFKDGHKNCCKYSEFADHAFS